MKKFNWCLEWPNIPVLCWRYTLSLHYNPNNPRLPKNNDWCSNIAYTCMPLAIELDMVFIYLNMFWLGKILAIAFQAFLWIYRYQITLLWNVLRSFLDLFKSLYKLKFVFSLYKNEFWVGNIKILEHYSCSLVLFKSCKVCISKNSFSLYNYEDTRTL